MKGIKSLKVRKVCRGREPFSKVLLWKNVTLSLIPSTHVYKAQVSWSTSLIQGWGESQGQVDSWSSLAAQPSRVRDPDLKEVRPRVRKTLDINQWPTHIHKEVSKTAIAHTTWSCMWKIFRSLKTGFSKDTGKCHCTKFKYIPIYLKWAIENEIFYSAI